MSDPVRSDDDVDAWIVATIQRALAYALTLVHNRTDAEDIVHDCYGRLLARAHLYDLPRDGSKLLFKAITNACINWTQRRAPEVGIHCAKQATGSDTLSLADKSAAEPVQQAMQQELKVAVEHALSELPVTQRAVIQLRCLGHSLIEVAEMLEITHDNARTLLHRGRSRMAIRLRPFLDENSK
jgi:RNA polymerase sigma-70 factor, ECF subfamily